MRDKAVSDQRRTRWPLLKDGSPAAPGGTWDANANQSNQRLDGASSSDDASVHAAVGGRDRHNICGGVEEDGRVRAVVTTASPTREAAAKTVSTARRRAEKVQSLLSSKVAAARWIMAILLLLLLLLLCWHLEQPTRDGAPKHNAHLYHYLYYDRYYDESGFTASMSAYPKDLSATIGGEKIATAARAASLPAVTIGRLNLGNGPVTERRPATEREEGVDGADGGNGEEDDDGDKERLVKILTALKNLDEEMEGDIVLVSNKTKFADAARVWQQRGIVLGPPLAVVEARTVQDVQVALPILAGLSRDFRLDFRVRSGGHSFCSEFDTVARGVVLSLSKLNAVSVSVADGVVVAATAMLPSSDEESDGDRAASHTTDAAAEATVTMQPGVTVEAFMRTVLDGHMLSGIIASAAGVGMGGFILGGGYGLQSRMYGLAVDNVKALDVVLTNGELKAGLQEGDDLFWALRGAGGGNLGVVTSVEYRVHPSRDTKLSASVKLPVSELAQFLQRLGDREPDLAPEFTMVVHRYQPPDNRTSPYAQEQPQTQSSRRNNWFNMHAGDTSHQRIPGEEDEEVDDDDDEDLGVVSLSMYWMGDANPDEQLGLQYIKETVVPLLSNVTADKVVYYYFSWSGMSRQREQDESWTTVWSAQSWNGFLLPTNNTEAVWEDIQSSMAAMFRYCKFVSPRVELWGGAISTVPPNATAFPHRAAVYNVGVELLVPHGGGGRNVRDAADDEARLVDAIWPSIARHLSGVYVNYPMPSLSQDEYPRSYWQGNLERLVQLRQQYDPFHVLNFSQSIPIVGEPPPGLDVS